jgi:hypothetical protein
MALRGVPPLVFAVVALIDLLYQFWVHTRLVGRLGWFDRWFCAPSNHRVHHAVNDVYLDRNYGGILVVWDRLFGSFQPELDDVPACTARAARCEAGIRCGRTSRSMRRSRTTAPRAAPRRQAARVVRSRRAGAARCRGALPEAAFVLAPIPRYAPEMPRCAAGSRRPVRGAIGATCGCSGTPTLDLAPLAGAAAACWLLGCGLGLRAPRLREP